jgi:TonB-linked SusC/RagA family outer membrane protein
MQIRKKSALQTVLFFILLSNALSAQLTQKLDIRLEKEPIKSFFTSIESKTDYTFMYKNLDLTTPVTIIAEQIELSIILNRVFAPLNITYEVSGQRIILNQQTAKDSPDSIGKRRLTGTVIDEHNEPIIGANVVERGTTNGVITDTDGKFSLYVSDNAVLQITYIGYMTQDITTVGKSVLTVILNENTEALDEVIVVGYGVQKKVNLTGSVENINGSYLSKKTMGQTSMALQGASPGITVQQSSGQPGKDGGTIRIRGIGTLSSVNPLILVDGVESDINSIDPNDIEAISVLKDAASSAIYGSRAANGVILITTHRAEKDVFRINYDSYIGRQSPTALPQMVSGYDHMVMLNEANRNVGRAEPFGADYIKEYALKAPSDQYPETNWHDVMLKKHALQHNHHVGINGGGEKVSILGALSYLNQDGITLNTNYERINLRLNTDVKIRKDLTAKFDVVIMTDNNETPAAGMPWYFLNRYPRNLQGKNEDGSWGVGFDGTNTWATEADGGIAHEKNYATNLNFKIDYTPVEGLNLSFQYAPRWNFYHNKVFLKTVNIYYPSGDLYNATPYRARLRERYTKSANNNLKGLITYDRKFSNHNLSILTGFEQVDYRGDWMEGFRDQYILENYDMLDAGSPANQTATGSATEWALRSFFGRVNYDYKQKYLLEANLRYDGSSRFAQGNKYGMFPSVSAGWRISEEQFMQDLEWINNLKLRASWGRLGNQEIGNYPFVSSVNLGLNYMFNQTIPGQGGAVLDAANPDITWETTTMSNMGFDVTLLSKWSITAEYYVKHTSDILLKLPIPATTGLKAAYQNAGEVRNKGWDFSIRYTDKIGGFNFNVGAHLSDVKNEITNLEGTGPYIYDRTIHAEGYPISSLYGLQAVGLFQTEDEIKNHATQFANILAPGDIQYKDQNNDGVINAEDRIVMGSYMPRYTFGLDFYGEYKNLDLSFMLQGVGKADGYIDQHGVLAFYMGGTAQEWHKNDHWTPENKNASYPRLTFNYPNNEQVSSYWIRNAAYLRCKNIQIGYTLPKSILNKVFIDYFRIYIAAQNLFTITDFYNSFDPEAPIGRGEFYPMMKVYSLGFNVKF